MNVSLDSSFGGRVVWTECQHIAEPPQIGCNQWLLDYVQINSLSFGNDF